MKVGNSILILPRIMGLTGVELAQPAADVLTFLFTVPLLRSVLREMV